MSAGLALTAQQKVTLVDCEAVIERGVRTFVEVGTALSQIRDSRLYRETHGTFEAYCDERWGFTDRRARQLIEAAAVGTIVPVTNEGQARELAKAPEDQRAEVWRETVERTDGKPTAAAVREVRNELIPVQRDIAQPIDEWPSIPEPGSGAAPPPAAFPPAPEPASERTDEDRDRELEDRMANTAARFRLNFSTALAKADDVWSFDLSRIAEVYGAPEDRESVLVFVREMRAWCDRVTEAFNKTVQLRSVGGGR